MISKVAAEAKVEAEAKAVDVLVSISVQDEKEEHLDEPLDNLVSITGDKTDVISELLDIQLENPASVQPLEYEAVNIMEATEVAAEASNKMKSICLEGSGDKSLEKHLDHLVSSDDVVKSISELLEVLFEDVLSAGVQPLENEMISKVAAEAKVDAEATDALMNVSVKDEKEEHLDEPLDNLVSITGDKTDVISELLDIQLENPASVQPLAEIMTEVFAAQVVAKHDLTFLATKAPKELLFTPLEVIEEETEEEPENKLLAETDVNKRDPPEEEPEIRKRKNRRGTRGKGRKINHNKDKNDSTSVSRHRGRAEGVRGQHQHQQEKRKTPPETRRPKTDSHQQRMTETHDRRQRTQQVLVTQRSSEQDIDQSNAMPYTMTFYRTGWRERRRTEGSRVECTPP
ncbi:hypothetical protein MHYP_G00197220 [Metynnis hypsauchen]